MQSLSEIVYFAQLKELYQWYNVLMSTVSPKHSIAGIPKTYSNLISSKTIFYFLQPQESFEENLYKRSRDIFLHNKIKDLESNIYHNLEALKEIGASLNKSLNFVGEFFVEKTKKLLDSFIDKIFLTEKREILSNHKELL